LPLAGATGGAQDAYDLVLSSVGMAWTILDRGLLLHASCVQTSLGVSVFPGPSGRGKSTLARLLAKDAILLSDDQTVLYPVGDRVNGKASTIDPSASLRAGCRPSTVPADSGTAASINGRYLADTTAVTNGRPGPLAGIYFLERGASSAKRRMSPGEAVRNLTRHTILWRGDAALHSLVLESATRIVESVPCSVLAVALSDISIELLRGS